MKVFSNQNDRYEEFEMQCVCFLGESMCVSLFDALFCYIRHPEEWSYDDEGYDIFALMRGFEKRGFTRILPEYYS